MGMQAERKPFLDVGAAVVTIGLVNKSNGLLGRQ